MKINGNMTNIEFSDDENQPHIYHFKTEIRGQCSKAQAAALRDLWFKKGNLDILEWDGVNPIYGLKIVLELDEGTNG